MQNVTQGKYYNIELIEPYTTKGPLFVQVTAICKLGSIELFGTNDIRDRYFADVGILTYLTLVNDDTDIYVTVPITNTEPLTTDNETTIFIPKSIIDFNASEEWRLKNRYSFSVEGITRYFENNLEQNAFGKSLENLITSQLNGTNELIGDILSVNISFTEFLASLSNIVNETNRRNKLIQEKQSQTVAQEQAAIDQKEYILNQQTILQEKIDQYEQAYANIQTQIDEATELSQSTSDFVTKQEAIKTYMSSIITYIAWFLLSNGLLTELQNLPTWDDIYNAFVEKRNNGSTLPNYQIGLQSITWKGKLLQAPANPEIGWFYYDLNEQKSLLFDGNQWNDFNG